MSELKNCPFCGSGEITEYRARKPLPDFDDGENGDWCFICHGCNSLHIFDSKQGWSRREE